MLSVTLSISLGRTGNYANRLMKRNIKKCLLEVMAIQKFSLSVKVNFLISNFCVDYREK